MDDEMQQGAIDLYSGIGGWNVGLEMARIQTIRSYEWWTQANETHGLNSSATIETVDIRKLDFAALPDSVEFVVGSPPCTQFSFANRGGQGDIEDGLRDVRKFLEIVRYLKPRGWAMENVPRVATILRKELAVGGTLSAFSDLVRTLVVVNMADYGLPQARRRMIAGSFDPELLRSYATNQPHRTLGDVVGAFQRDPVIDPVYGGALPLDLVTGRDEELPLDWEELRMNREAKRFHPVYNLMQFPDSLARPARTVTATCTRVSRESIVIETGHGIRRPTLRERASLQGFPIDFQFKGRTYGDCQTMAGNAFPPLMAYFVAQALLGTPEDRVAAPARPAASPQARPVATPAPGPPRRRYPPHRRFRAAIPNLRFGSGMRFELANGFASGMPEWNVGFYFGPSKTFESVAPDHETTPALRASPRIAAAINSTVAPFARLDEQLRTVTAQSLQDAWTHVIGGLHPFQLTDHLGDLTSGLVDAMGSDITDECVAALVQVGLPLRWATSSKVRSNATAIVAGFVVGSWLNSQAIANRDHARHTA